MGIFHHSWKQRARQIDSLLCVGLDPHPADLPDTTAAGGARFLPAPDRGHRRPGRWPIKPNAAFFEAFGPAGWAALQEVIAAVPPDIPVILDAKRGDIASTAEAYARSAFETLGADAITAQPVPGTATRSSPSCATRSAASSCCARPPTPARPTCRT